MEILVSVAAEAVGILLIAVVVSKMKSRVISETQSVPWLISAVIVMILGIFPKIVNIVADWFGVWYPPTILFVIIIVLIVFIIFNHSSTMTKLINQVSELSMQVTILKDELKELQKKAGENKSDSGKGGDGH